MIIVITDESNAFVIFMLISKLFGVGKKDSEIITVSILVLK